MKRNVDLMFVNPVDFSTVCAGFSYDCKSLLKLVLPGLSPQVYEREDVQELLKKCNETGKLYLSLLVPGEKVIATCSLKDFQIEAG